MDLLADMVAGLELRSSLYFRAILSAPFAVAVPEQRSRIRLHVVGPGRCWIGLGSGEGVSCGRGDLLLVPHGAAHVLASAPGLDGVALASIARAARREQEELPVLRWGGGGAEVTLVCGHFEFDEACVHPLVRSLPPLIHLAADSGTGFGWMPALLETVEREARMGSPGHEAVARRLSEILFIQILRALLAREPGASGLLGALGETVGTGVGRALAAIHADPSRDWTLVDLGSLAGASRSAFAAGFRERLGVSPMRYVALERLRRARRLLHDGSLSVGEVGRRVGYASEAAFNRAFREAVGMPPGRFRRSLLHSRAQASASGSTGKSSGRESNSGRGARASTLRRRDAALPTEVEGP